MIRIDSRPFAAVLAALALAAPAAQAESYMINPKPPCIISPAGYCWTPVKQPAGWKCHWSMDLKGTEIKSLTVNGGPAANDATPCDLKACTAACASTSGCVAVDIMKPAKINGEWNIERFGNSKCVCTLFSSVTSATKFEEIRSGPNTISGWACMRTPKSPPPPITEIPQLHGSDRPAIDQDTARPSTADPGHRRR